MSGHGHCHTMYSSDFISILYILLVFQKPEAVIFNAFIIHFQIKIYLIIQTVKCRQKAQLKEKFKQNNVFLLF